MVGGKVGSVVVNFRCCVSLVRWSGGGAVIFFCMTTRTDGGGVLCQWWRQKGKLVKIMSK